MRMRRAACSILTAALVVGCTGSAPGGARSRAPAPPEPEEAPARAPEPDPVEAGRAPPPGPYARGIDVLHYGVELTLSRNADTIVGRARIRFRRTDAGVERLPLDLTGLAVDSVLVGAPGRDDAGTVPPNAYRPSLAEGSLPVPLPEGGPDTMTVRVFYRGTPDDGLILGRTVHGVPSAFADNWPNRARFWFPSVDHPSDKATVGFVVHAPSDWDVVANGTLEGPPSVSDPGRSGDPGSERRTWRWKTRLPIPTYTMVVGATSLERSLLGVAACGRAPASPRSDGCVEVSTWLYPESEETAARSFRRAPEMVDFFTDRIGPFPYEKLANVQSSTRFGGMENASAIFYSERALDSGRNAEGTVSHEIAHQWFGDAVTESDWHHLWLSEGFATFFGVLFFEFADGEESFRRRMAEARRQYLSSDVVDRPIVDPEVDDLFELLNANNYSKGGWILHMLRGVVGDEAFFRGVRAYYREHRHGTALTTDFRRAMEEASGRSLEWFFQQWIFRPGHPLLRIDWRHDADADILRVRVEQRQREAWPTFQIPARLRVTTSDGSTRTHEVEIRERTEELELPASAVPTSVELDPRRPILGRVTIVGPGS